MIMNVRRSALSLVMAGISLFSAPVSALSAEKDTVRNEEPCIVNFINFIRKVEPRNNSKQDRYLYKATRNELKQLNDYGFRSTFLLQYDALISPEFQRLMKKAESDGHEVGAWWEITEPHVKKAGLEWHGRYPWDWHAHVGFATGYTPQERERLVDVYMEEFRNIFGYYPTSVGSWFIDAHTLAYMYDRYNIVASCNCKDQVGTDGYTLWGGYWNQAYYPSRLNAYMPAQTSEGQIPVPVFRMLSSDPIYQYYSGIGCESQGVLTLEPVYTGAGGGGGVQKWIDWFLPAMAQSESLTFNYVQAGQENSFGWKSMKKGLEMQMPVFRKLTDEGAFRVETLSESGRWYKENFQVTPVSSVAVSDDFLDKDKGAVWYDSRFYRAGLYWSGNDFLIRDIHMFDEKMESDYLRKPLTTTYCEYITPPFIDGFFWSTENELAGLRLVTLKADGIVEDIPVNSYECKETGDNVLTVFCNTDCGQFQLLFNEDAMTVSFTPSEGAESLEWALEFTAAKADNLPFTEISDKSISASHRGYDYNVRLIEGNFSSKDPSFANWCILPENNRLILSGVLK
jgi:hypothetical protein